MNDKLEYAEQWDSSAAYFYENKYYDWMAEHLASYKTILEIGCGTGYSTLALVEQGYRVIAVDKNIECISKAKKLIEKTGHNDQVVFVSGDVADDDFKNKLINEYEFDVVACWNIGTYWNKEMMEYYLPYLLKYGLNINQIRQNPESSYSELIIWETCDIASRKNAVAHIVDRGTMIINEKNDPYYYLLKNEFSFNSISYDNKKGYSLSKGGRILATNGKVSHKKKVPIIFTSLLYK